MNKRVAIVTGCGKYDGLGAAIARALVAANVTVAVTDLNMEGAKSETEDTPPPEKRSGIKNLVADLRQAGGEAEYLLGDVSNEIEAERLVTQTVERYGRLDILVNNAAAPHGEEFNYLADIPLSAYDKVMNVNARGTFAMMRAATPHMRRTKWGRIVNIASVAGRAGAARATVYSASKAAIIQMTRCLAIELGPDGINVNAVCPGRMMTSRAYTNAIRRFGREKFEEQKKQWAAELPVRRMADPSEIAAVVAFLCSDSASYLTGQSINVDGGMYPM